MKQKFFLICLFFLGFPGWAVTGYDSLETVTGLPAVSDSIMLGHVTVYGQSISRFSAGEHLYALDSASLSRTFGGNLAQVLAERTSLYIRQYGAGGQIATAGIRGAGPGHTALLWNGVPLNSPSLGLTDLSLLPAMVMDRTALQYGANSALYGSDAVGGTIHVQSDIENSDPGLSVYQQYGSFGDWFSGIDATWHNGNWKGKSRLYYHQAQNDFEVKSNRPGPDHYRQPNASFNYYGMMQQLQWEPKDQQSLQLDIWYHHHDRQVQPRIGDLQAEDRQSDENFRASIQFQNRSKQLSWHHQLGLVRDFQQYNQLSPIKTFQISGRSHAELPVGRHLFRAGVSLQSAHAQSASLDRAQQQQADFFAASSLKWGKRWHLNFNIRQSLISGIGSPLAPSVSASYYAWNWRNHEIIWHASGGRSFKAPTLNQRFWNPGGNPDILPEQGWTFEGGPEWLVESIGLKGNLRVQYYRMWIDDWIIWMPQTSTVWSPENIQSVNSQGLEAQSSWNWNVLGVKMRLEAQYTWARSLNRSLGWPSEGTYNAQLPYVPEHRINSSLHIQKYKWNAGVQAQYTSRRYTTFDNLNTITHSMDPYAVADVYLGYRFAPFSGAWSLTGWVRNVTNANYQNSQFLAMPGRHYTISAVFNFL